MTWLTVFANAKLEQLKCFWFNYVIRYYAMQHFLLSKTIMCNMKSTVCIMFVIFYRLTSTWQKEELLLFENKIKFMMSFHPVGWQTYHIEWMMDILMVKSINNFYQVHNSALKRAIWLAETAWFVSHQYGGGKFCAKTNRCSNYVDIERKFYETSL